MTTQKMVCGNILGSTPEMVKLRSMPSQTSKTTDLWAQLLTYYHQEAAESQTEAQTSEAYNLV